MKTYIKSLAVATALLLTQTSCKDDFLNEDILSSYSPQTLTDANAFDAAIVGIHSQYALWHTIGGESAGTQGFLCIWQMGTDVAFNKAVADLDPLAIAFTNYENLTPTHEGVQYSWKWAYNLINNCNILIANADKSTVLDAATKNAYKAEAQFFRAVAYNTLATLFGRVPLITAPLDGPKTDFTRAPLAEVNKLIVDDLTFAKANLPTLANAKANANGKLNARPHRAMASQLLAEVFLRTGDNAQAEAEANTVLNSGEFKLVTNRYGVKASQPGDAFSDMFHYGNQRRSQGNTEAIWVLELENPTSVVGGTGITASNLFPNYTFGAPQHRRVWGSRYHQQPGMVLTDSLGGRGISRMALTYYVLNGLYGPGDMRNSRFNIRRQYYYNNPSSPNFGKPVVPGPGVDTTRLIVPQINKWNQFNPNDAFGFAMIKDIIIARLGETYLLKAEAQFKQGNLTGAAATLNILRARAGAAPISPADVTMDFILDERARELIGEENRRMTLMRTGTLVKRATRYGQKITGLTEKHLLLPIPLTEIQLNKDGVLEQNPGY